MKIKLNKEQKSYIKSLDSNEARKEFFLKAVIANICDSPSKEINDDDISYSKGFPTITIGELTQELADRAYIKLQKKISAEPEKSDESANEKLEFDMLKDDVEYLKQILQSATSHHFLCLEMINSGADPTNILNQYLLAVQKAYFLKTKDNIDFIIDLFPQLKNDKND